MLLGYVSLFGSNSVDPDKLGNNKQTKNTYKLINQMSELTILELIF